jgi:predicted N-acetyltransferase YhbS
VFPLCSLKVLVAMLKICPAAPADELEITALLDAGFGPARHNRTAYRLRDGVGPLASLSFVVRDGAALVGSLQCWPLQIRGLAGHPLPLVLLGPVVTAADRQGEGIATRMMNAALAAADADGAPPLLLIGDAPFYGRFGFSADATADWQIPGPVDRARLLLRGDASRLPRAGSVEPRGAARHAA